MECFVFGTKGWRLGLTGFVSSQSPCGKTVIIPFFKGSYVHLGIRQIGFVFSKLYSGSAWFYPGWQPQAQLGDGKAPREAQPSPNPLDLRLPPFPPFIHKFNCHDVST
jgi:hypothetical protein